MLLFKPLLLKAYLGYLFFTVHIDTAILREYYHRPEGRLVTLHLRRLLLDWWPVESLRQQRLLGVGYTPPLLEVYQTPAIQTIAAMLPRMGVHPWPTGGRGKALLSSPIALPFPDCSIDKVLCLHLLEGTGNPRPVLRELWRVLKPEGKILLITANRLSPWARREHSPFASGQPYSLMQLEHLLTNCAFDKVRSDRGLYLPATRRHIPYYYTNLYAKAARALCPAFGGVVMVEGRKTLEGLICPEPVRGKKHPALKTATAFSQTRHPQNAC